MVFGEPMGLDRLHIELTSRCTLECPACARTQWRQLTKMPMPKQDLDIEDFKKFMDCDAGRATDTLLLCGDYGDTIYYPYLFEFLNEFREEKKFIIKTNGSRQTKEFWTKLANLLDERDVIVFAIDGLEEDNHLYRKNSDWNSTMLGLDIMSAQSRVKVKWQTIVFNFNQTRLDKIKEFAEAKGAEWYSILSHRFGDEDLKPKEQFIQTQFLFKEEYVENSAIELEPQCNQEKVVTSDGYLLPCDWIRNPNTLYGSQLWKQKDRWMNKLRIDQTDYSQALEIVKDWSEFVRSSALQGNAEVLCKMKCRKNCSGNR